jgi:hypothetical protein
MKRMWLLAVLVVTSLFALNFAQTGIDELGENFAYSAGQTALPVLIAAVLAIFGVSRNYLLRFSIIAILAGTFSQLVSSHDNRLVFNCPVSVARAPKDAVIELAIPGQSAKSTQLTRMFESGFARIECYPLPLSSLGVATDPVTILSGIAANGGELVKSEMSSNLPVPHRYLLTNKAVDGIDVATKWHMFVFENSFVIVTLATRSDQYPSSDAQAFFDDITLVKE